MKALIIGCGYVGKALAKKWHDRKDTVTVTTTTPSKIEQLTPLASQAVLCRGDHQERVKELSHGQDVVVVSVAPSRRGQDIRAIYLDTARTLLQGAREGADFKKLIYVGTASVYGDHSGDWVDESTLLQPLNERQAVFMETEQTFQQLTELSREVITLRLGEIYGPGREIASRVEKMGQEPLPGDGLNLTNLIHLEDIVEAIHFLTPPSLFGTFNLCNATHLTRKEFYKKICLAHGLPEVTWNPNRPSFHGGKRKLCTQKLQDLGFTFRHPHYRFEPTPCEH